MEPHLTATGCHLPYGITQCYLPPDTSDHTLALTPATAERLVLDLPNPGMEGSTYRWRYSSLHIDVLPTNRQSPIQVAYYFTKY